MPPRILLADADAFFVEVARQIDPEGAGRAKLLLVGGSPTQRGVVCSASYEARRFGVRSAMPMSQAVRLCPQAMVVAVPRAACAQRSHAIFDVLSRFAPVVAPASIDEWYLDLSGTERLYKEPLASTARRIRATVQDELGLPLSLGGGTNKLIAKLAVELAKRPPPGGERGAYIVKPGDEAAFMTRFRLGDIPMVGKKLEERLASAGLRTVADALPYDEALLQGMLGERLGSWLFRRVRGICEDKVMRRETAVSIGREETFASDLQDDEQLRRELLTLLSQATAELRRSGYRARTLTVRIKDADFRQRQKSRTLPAAVESERALWPLAQTLFAELRTARSIDVRLLGVSLSSLVLEGAQPIGGTQLALFESQSAIEAAAMPIETERDRAVSRLRDAVQRRFGADALHAADSSDFFENHPKETR